MYILLVDIRVRPEHLEAFKAATLENARSSLQEPGVVRFDVVQDLENPTHMMLIEVYRTPDDHPKHRETPHYAIWRDTVADMMDGARTATRCINVFPDDAGWN